MTDYKPLNVHSDASGQVKIFYLVQLSDEKTVKELTLVVDDEARKTPIREATANEIKNEMVVSLFYLAGTFHTFEGSRRTKGDLNLINTQRSRQSSSFPSKNSF